MSDPSQPLTVVTSDASGNVIVEGGANDQPATAEAAAKLIDDVHVSLMTYHAKAQELGFLRPPSRPLPARVPVLLLRSRTTSAHLAPVSILSARTGAQARQDRPCLDPQAQNLRAGQLDLRRQVHAGHRSPQRHRPGVCPLSPARPPDSASLVPRRAPPPHPPPLSHPYTCRTASWRASRSRTTTCTLPTRITGTSRAGRSARSRWRRRSCRRRSACPSRSGSTPSSTRSGSRRSRELLWQRG